MKNFRALGAMSTYLKKRQLEMKDRQLSSVESIQLARSILATDQYSFIQAAFPVLSGGTTLQLNWHIEAVAYQLDRVRRGEINRLIITMPPRSLKSICASVAFPAYVWGHAPQTKFICVSYSHGLALKHANDFRALVKSPFYRRVFRRTQIDTSKDTEYEITTLDRGFRLATSVGGTLTGRGADIIIIDDPLKAIDAYSAQARDALWHWYTNTLLSRLDHKAKGAIILVMQRLHVDDLAGRLLEQPGWTHLNLPAIAEAEDYVDTRPNGCYHRKLGGLLHPARESRAVLQAQKNAMGSLEFAAQYQQAPVPPEGNLVKRTWVKYYETAPVPRQGDRIIVSWDTASSSEQLASYSACVILLARGETVYILDVIRARLEYPELKRAVLAQHARWRHRADHYSLLIEKAGAGLSLLQDLRHDNIHAIGVTPNSDKVMRMAGETALIEAGGFYLPAQASWLGDFQRELYSFPASKYNDQVDALSQGLHRAKMPGPPTVLTSYYHILR